MISAVDLFCGVGGLTHGLQQARIDVRLGIDVDPACKFPYRSNNKAQFLNRDITRLSGTDIKRGWDGEKTTLLAGCAPCQPFSTYSRASRKSKPNQKWDLVREFARLIRESQPDLVTMENVSQLVRHDVFQEFLKALSDFHVWYSVVDCSEYGVPQTRKRLVLLASKLGPISLRRQRFSKPVTVGQVIRELPHLNAGDADTADPIHQACRLSPLNLRRIQASKPGGSWRDWPEELLADCHRRVSGETYPSVYGRMEWNSLAPTITTQCFGYGNGRFGHPVQDRAITLREAAMLQTFPKSYKFIPKSEKVVFYILGRLIGNAVPVKLAKTIGCEFIKHVKAHSL
ncbi:MAG: DNA (cytosine-5-)-methyltransferase [Cyanobacteria bacterium P01_F01_bin.150]